MTLIRRLPLATAILLVPVLLVAAPPALDATRLIAAQNDPVALADATVARKLSPQRVAQEVTSALDHDDVELAQSFAVLAKERGIAIDSELLAKIDRATAAAATAANQSVRFARGFLTGEPTDLVELAGTATGDLFVFGDIRDAARESARLATGEPADTLILGLAGAGLAITAGTYFTAGAAAPARVGLSLVKAARKTGRLGGRLAAWTGRTVRDVVDTAALRGTVSWASLVQPAIAVRAARDAVKVEKMQPLLAAAGDLARLQHKAGTRAALDGMAIAEGPRDLSRLARLAESQGGKTRAILKLGGRAAIALTIGALNLASWLLWASAAAIGFCASAKRATERATERWLQQRKRRRARRSARLVPTRQDLDRNLATAASPG